MGRAKLAAIGGLGVAAVSGLAWAIKHFLRNRGYDDLDSVVSFSSRLVAGMRAFEGKEREPLFEDPLAELLAGRRGMQAAENTMKHFEDAAEEGEEASKPDRTYLVGRVALRTLFYDDHLLAAVKGGAIRQVVLLGAGMDSRAWRLDLPKGVAWFEIDRADVLNAKTKVLTSARAAFSLDAKGAQFPLRAASYSSCDVDLGSKGWTKDLIAAGFDPEVPTVWIAEGLFMYLSEAAVTTLMKEARAVSAKGSRLLIMAFTTKDLIQWYQNTATQFLLHAPALRSGPL
ncbi:hypothetical protein WJX75_005035 [Coccomyxa subellipsoidea]|uniref:S-adenosyl-L-methionine-dependent methyltransferase n=1 Tax=Coccomyxa subellipsoidea TaxID=248742 RepID=A0ABR2YPI6_9CHLO